jgi:hypothetical protein
MKDPDLKSLSLQIQKAYEGKKIDEVLGFYHPEIVLIGPSMRVPVKGIDELRMVLEEQFNSPRRSMVKLSDFTINRFYGSLPDRGAAVDLLFQLRFQGVAFADFCGIG